MLGQNSKLLNKVQEFVKSSYTKDGVTSSTFNHQLETAEIVKELDANASDELLIAALSHDIERAFRKDDMFEILKSSEDGFKSAEFLERHQGRGAEIMKDFLRNEGASSEFQEKVASLIAVHEIGGNKDANLLKDADSLSFFRSVASRFVKTKIDISSKEKVEAKLRWMYERISSDKVKKMAEPHFKEAMKELGA